MANYDLTYEGSRVQGILDTGNSLKDAGYIFRGEATPSTVPGTPTERVAYIGGPGTYTNFGSSITVGAGCICVFKYTGSAWSNQVINTGLDSAVNTLQSAITAINNNIGNGYVYAGVATPSTSPVTGKVFYLAVQAGTYTNFGNAVVTAGLNVLKYNGSAWSVDQVIAIDAEPTQGSANLVKSGGVLNSIIQNGPAFDLSAYNAQGGVLATYADLSAALTALNALPADFKKGGMSFKFVLTSDNNYVKFFCMAQNFTTDVTQWQGADDEPTAGSNNLVKSGGVKKCTVLKVESAIGKNLFDSKSEDILTGKYFTSVGDIVSSEYFNISGFIPVSPTTAYHISVDGNNPVYNTGDPIYFVYYNDDLEKLSVVAKAMDITTPSGAYFMRITYRADKTYIMVNTGTSRGTYEQYNPINGYLSDIIENLQDLREDVNEEIQELQEKKVDVKYGKNLFDKNSEGIYHGGYMVSSGEIAPNELFNVSDFIPVAASTSYHISAKDDTPVYNTGDPVYYAYYDSSKELIETVAKGENKTTHSSAAYMRITYRADKEEVMVNIGSSRGVYENYNPIDGYLNELKDDIYKKVTEKAGKNLFNKNSEWIYHGGYMLSNGIISPNPDFNVSDYLLVQPSTDYYISAKDNTPVYNTGDPVYYGFYDSSKTLLSTVAKGESKTTPSNTAYMRITYRANKEDVMVNKGTSRGVYEEYNPVGGYLPDIKNRQVMNIYTTDTETEIVSKLVSVFQEGDYDVYFETGVYNFSQAFELLHSMGMHRELPVGGNCRYFLNNSTLIGTPYTSEKDIKVMGTQWSNQTFELHDGTLKCVGGSYSFHDESYGEQGYCRHLFHNIHFVYESSDSTNQYRKCYGCGLGESSDIIIEGCIFETDYDSADSPDFGAHTASNQSLVHNVKFLISNCYFSRGILASSGGGAAGTGVKVQLSNCSYKELTESTWIWTKFCNDVRS